MKKLLTLFIITSSVSMLYAADNNNSGTEIQRYNNGTNGDDTQGSPYYYSQHQTQQKQYQYKYSDNGSDQTITGSSSDQQLALKIKNTLQSDLSNKYNSVTVSANNGYVTLRGSVATQDDKEALEKKISNMDEVKGVNNQLIVQNVDTDLDTDSDLSPQVLRPNGAQNTTGYGSSTYMESYGNGDKSPKTLTPNGDTSTYGSSTYTEKYGNGNNGSKTLTPNGDTSTYGSSTYTEKYGNGNKGSKTLTPNGDTSTYGSSNAYADQTPSATQNGGTDQILTTQIKNTLKSVFPSIYNDVSVTVSKGVVTLSGSVPSQTNKDNLEKLVRGIVGVKGVNNQLTVKNT